MLAATGRHRWLGLALGVLACSSERTPAEDASAATRPDSTSCSEQSNASSLAVAAALDSAGRSCARDSDCSFVGTGTDCWEGCGAVVAAASQPQLEAVLDQQNRTTCAGFRERGCTAAIPPCVPPGSAACLAGECGEFLGEASSATPVLATRRDQAVELAVDQRLELRLQTIGPGNYLDPRLSNASLRFTQSFLPQEQNPGGPTQVYVFQAVNPGSTQITIPHSVQTDAFVLTVSVR